MPDPSKISAKTLGKKRARNPESDGEQQPSDKTQKKKRGSENKEPKKKPRSRVATEKPRIKAEPEAAKRGGRQTGSCNFSDEETLFLLGCMTCRVPIANAGSATSLKAKYDASKPTGCATCDPDSQYAIALTLKEAIDTKAGTLTINDPEFDEPDHSDGTPDGHDSVIEISDNDVEPSATSKHAKQ
ncbi:hypothetical protein DXG01_011201 [Tephrocybe rancida]|nr:hypothetical protein DXG01_011201 [Tephrocybe rancida]